MRGIGVGQKVEIFIIRLVIVYMASIDARMARECAGACHRMAGDLEPDGDDTDRRNPHPMTRQAQQLHATVSNIYLNGVREIVSIT